MKKTPLKTGGNDNPWTPSEIDDLAKQVTKWSKQLDKTKGADASFRKRLAAIAAALTFTGCQAFPTLTHPRTGFNYDWTPVIPYTPPAYYGYGYYPEPDGISRNDFIIAAEGGF